MDLSNKYPVYDISEAFASNSRQFEYLGTKTKAWITYRFNDRLPHEQRVLFKEGRPGTGENWAEKVTSELAGLLYLPHAYYHLAILEQHRSCVITPNFLLEGEELRLGNQFIENFRGKGHTLEAIFHALEKNEVHLPWVLEERVSLIKTASEQFVGYLLFDAWVGNTDRHAENWGIITTPDRINVLAPTFDHASSLGRNESDKKRSERLKTKDKGYTVSAFVQKWVAPIYDERGNSLNMTTLVKKCKAIFPQATAYWIEEIFKIMAKGEKIKIIFDRIPDNFISTPAREFAMEILNENSKRLKELQYD